ncbi:hypothetical protein CTI12_AA384970 [Artemisia annua]|uniref:Uncharacterized protein n=1 Tax=Artemisia annua TaxID=35608 RepID=A0A2U1MFU6_ARTAN|nr:hypothetical protein CTI12_AA384970 [Artemisia annua]
MAPPPHTANHLVHLSTCSKAQTHLFKILHIISSFPTNNNVTSEKLGSDDVDLAVDNDIANQHSEISHVGEHSSNEQGVQSEEVNDDIKRDEGLLGLLLEAVEFVEKPAKRKCWTAATEAEWYAEFEDTSPVVRSKRGRNQVLPYKYRDSVVEPLVRMPQTSSKRMSIRRS